MKRILRRFKAWLRYRKAARKLKDSGYEDWAQYRRNRDPNVDLYQDVIKKFYVGYPYIYKFEDPNHFVYTRHDCGPGGIYYGYYDAQEWCEKHIMAGYRVDAHRVYKNQYGEDELCEFAGHDFIFFAFKREQDLIHFLLRWS